jgi:hypothetical protein
MVTDNPDAKVLDGFDMTLPNGVTITQPKINIEAGDAGLRRFGDKTLAEIEQWEANAMAYIREFELALNSNLPGIGTTFGEWPVYNGLKQALLRDIPNIKDPTIANPATRRSPFAIRKSPLRGLLQKIPIAGVTFYTREDVVKRLSGIFGRAAQQAMGRMRDVYNQTQGLLTKTKYWGRDLQKMRRAAVESHPTLKGDMDQYRRQVMNPMAHMGRQAASPLAVGVLLPTGHRVTREDMEFLNRLLQYNRELLNIVQRYPGRQTVEEVRGQKLSRPAGSVGDFEATRHINADGANATLTLAQILRSEPAHRIGATNDWSSTSANEEVQFWNEQAREHDVFRALLQDAWRSDLGYVLDTNLRGAMQQWADDIRNGDYAQRVNTLEEFEAGLNSRLAGQMPALFVRQEIISLFDQMAKFAKERNQRFLEAPTNMVYIENIDAESEFTKSANRLELPSTMYDYLPLTDGEVQGQTQRAMAPSELSFLIRMQQVEKELAAKLEAVAPKRGQGVPASQVGSLSEAELHDLHALVKNLNNLMAQKPKYDIGVGAIASRVSRQVGGALLARGSVFTGNLISGQTGIDMAGDGVRKFLHAAWWVHQARRLANILPRMFLTYAHRIGGQKARKMGREMKRLGLLGPFENYLTGLFHQLVETERLGLTREGTWWGRPMSQMDTVALQPNERDRRGRMEQGFARTLTATEGTLGTLTDATGLSPDDALNAMATEHAKDLEARLKDLAPVYNARLGTNVPSSTSPDKAVKAGEAGISLNDLAKIREHLSSVGLTLEEVLLRQRTGQDLLSPEEMDSLKVYFATAANKATPYNRPEILRSSKAARFFLILQGYMTNQTLALTSRMRQAQGHTGMKYMGHLIGGALLLGIGLWIWGLLTLEGKEAWLRFLGFNSGQPAPHEPEFWKQDEALLERLLTPIGLNAGTFGDVLLTAMRFQSQNRGFELNQKFLPLNFVSDLINASRRSWTYEWPDKLKPWKELALRYGPLAVEASALFDLNLRREWNDGVRSMAAAMRATGVQSDTANKSYSADAYTAATPIRANLREAGIALADAKARGDTAAVEKYTAAAKHARDRLLNYYTKSKGYSAEEARTAARRDYTTMDPARMANGGKEPTASEIATATANLSGSRLESYQRTVRAWQSLSPLFPNKKGETPLPEPGMGAAQEKARSRRRGTAAPAGGVAGTGGGGGGGGASLGEPMGLPGPTGARSSSRGGRRPSRGGSVRLRRGRTRRPRVPRVRSVRLRRRVRRPGARRRIRLRRPQVF